MAPKPKKPRPALEIVARALCRIDPEERLEDGRCLWETKDREARRILAALKEADPEELRTAIDAA